MTKDRSSKTRNGLTATSTRCDTEATGTAPPFQSTSGLWRTKTLILTSDGLFGGEPQPTRILQGCATCALRRSLRSSRQIKSGRSTREQSSSQNVDTRTASTSVISRRLCHEPVPLHFPIFRRCVFADFSNCRFFDTFELFELLPAFSWSCRCFSNFSSFFLCIITRSSSFFDDSLGFIIFYGFSFFLSSPNFMLVLSLPPCFSILYLPANFCQFFRAQVVLRTTPFLSRPIRTTLLSKVLSFLVH